PSSSRICMLMPVPRSPLFFFLIIRPPPRSTLFPYTTLFRSLRPGDVSARVEGLRSASRSRRSVPLALPDLAHGRAGTGPHPRQRSEEHTSELQSLTNLVCRLLLEKKKHYNKHSNLSNDQVLH